jgi:hypothetical protein
VPSAFVIHAPIAEGNSVFPFDILHIVRDGDELVALLTAGSVGRLIADGPTALSMILLPAAMPSLAKPAGGADT